MHVLQKLDTHGDCHGAEYTHLAQESDKLKEDQEKVGPLAPILLMPIR